MTSLYTTRIYSFMHKREGNACLALPDPTLKYREGVRGQATCAIGISKLRGNCITVVGVMRIIIQVQQWLLNPRCVWAVAT